MDPTDAPYEGITGQVLAVCVALDERDTTTRSHCDRVRGLAVELAKACSLTDREIKLVVLAAGFHDVGKIGVPDHVLKKEGTLSPEEWRLMQTHPVRSERILAAAALRDGAEIAAAVRHHHERVDGHGYPDGLADEAIPPIARIIAIADAYDAMARLRHYGMAKAHTFIMRELRTHQGQQHDAHMVTKFASFIERSPCRAPDRT